MFTPSHGHSASIDAVRTAFRHAAEAREQARAPAAPLPATWPPCLGRLATAVASVMISIGLLVSVVMGLTSTASPAGMSVATVSAPRCELVAS